MSIIPSTCLVARRATRTRKKMQRAGRAESDAREPSLEVAICCKYERQLSSYGIFEPGKGPRPRRSDTATTDASVTSLSTSADICDADSATAATTIATARERRITRTRSLKRSPTYEEDSGVPKKRRITSTTVRSGRRGRRKGRDGASNHLLVNYAILKKRALTTALNKASTSGGIVTVIGDVDESDNDEQMDDSLVPLEKIIKFNKWLRCQNLRNLALKLFMKNKSTEPASNRSAAIECDSSPLEIAIVSVEDESILKSPLEAEDSKLTSSNVLTGQASNGLNYDFSFLRKKRLPTTGMQTPRFRYGGASGPLGQECSSLGRMYLEHASTSTPKNPLYGSGSFNFDPFKSGNALSNSMPDISRSLMPLTHDKSGRRTDKKANTRRGLLTDHLNSSDSVRRLQQSVCRSGIFSTHNNEDKGSWELWGYYFNVLIEKGKILGSGSFAKVYKAKLRSFLGFKSDDNSDLDPFLAIVAKNCASCKNVHVLDCAVKSIMESSSQATSQYTREREMMLHFNCNVLKPLACRRVFDISGTCDQLLMPMAQGDLLSMLTNLVQERTRCVGASHVGTAKPVGLVEDEAKFLFYQILSGVAFIQMCFQCDVYRHCDLKLANVVVYCDKTQIYDPLRWRLCIADFGSAILLHPTLQLEGVAQSKFPQDVSKDWSSYVGAQLTSFTRGTVRYNAPEALSFDKCGQHRNDPYQRLLSVYRKLDPQLLSSPSLKDAKPKVWSQMQYNVKLAPYTPKSIRLSIPMENENVEFYIMSMTADLWSCGIILAELCKFGTKAPVPGSLANSLDHHSKISSDIKSTLGAGLFGRAHRGKSGLSDVELNKLLAQEIAKACNVDYSTRLYNIKRLFNSRERPDYSPEFYDLLTRLLAYEPHQRPIAAEALGHDWFNNIDFDALDHLGIGTRHLPMEHFYCLSNDRANLLSNANGNNVGGFGTSTRSPAIAATGTGAISPGSQYLASPNSGGSKTATPFDYGNSDFSLCSLGNFGKLNQRGHAWYTGPLHYRLNLLQEQLGTRIRLNEYVLRICSRETIVLEHREAKLFGARGYILAALMQIKREHQLEWPQVTSSWCAHVLGKALARNKIDM